MKIVGADRKHYENDSVVVIIAKGLELDRALFSFTGD